MNVTDLTLAHVKSHLQMYRTMKSTERIPSSPSGITLSNYSTVSYIFSSNIIKFTGKKIWVSGHNLTQTNTDTMDLNQSAAALVMVRQRQVEEEEQMTMMKTSVSLRPLTPPALPTKNSRFEFYSTFTNYHSFVCLVTAI